MNETGMDDRTRSEAYDNSLHPLMEQVAQQLSALPAPHQADAADLLRRLAERTAQLERELEAERRAAKQARAESRRLIDENYCGVVVFELERDHSGRVTGLIIRDANANFAEGVRRPLEALLGRRLNELFPGYAAADDTIAVCQKAADSGQTIWFSTDLTPVDRHVAATVFPLGENRVALTGVDVTEYLHALEMRRTLQAIMDYTPIGLLGAVGRHGFISRYGQQVFGSPNFEMSYIGSLPPGWSLLTEKGREPVAGENFSMARSLRSGEEARNEVYILANEDGRETPILVNSGPVRDEGGQIIGAVLSWVDITEQKQAEERLRYQAMILDQTQDAIIATDRNLKITLWNEAAQKLYGYAPEEVFGRDLVGVLMPDIDTGHLNEMEKRLRAEGLHRMESLRRRKDGSYVPVEVNGRLIYDSLGEAVGYIGSHRDITERKQAEEALRRSEERFRVALQNSPLVVSNLDLNLRYTWVYYPPNPRAAAAFTGKRATEVMPEGGAELEALALEALAAGAGVRREVRIDSGVSYRLFDLAVEPLRDDEGRVTGLTCAGMDVTEQRRLEDKVRQSSAQAEVHRHLVRQREMERQEIARDLHDGPLQDLYGISFFLAELQRQGITAPGKTAELEEGLAHIDRMLQQNIQSVRDFCNNLRPPTLAHFGVDKAILTHLEGFQVRHPEIRVQLAFHTPDDGHTLPAPASTALYRVYQEMMHNVVRHSQADEVAVRYELTARQALLEVQDNGVGFALPPEWLDLARQGHLGLVGMLERLEAVGGYLEVESRPGAGTRVRAVVPRLTDPADSPGG